jgi:hypothetical protein
MKWRCLCRLFVRRGVQKLEYGNQTYQSQIAIWDLQDH